MSLSFVCCAAPVEKLRVWHNADLKRIYNILLSLFRLYVLPLRIYPRFYIFSVPSFVLLHCPTFVHPQETFLAMDEKFLADSKFKAFAAQSTFSCLFDGFLFLSRSFCKFQDANRIDFVRAMFFVLAAPQSCSNDLVEHSAQARKHARKDELANST